jgi:hypothetical protein
VTAGKLTLDALQPGVTCEHCHTGAAAHMESISNGKPAVSPLKLGTLSAEDQSNFCGQCHRTWESIVRQRLWGEANVRFQPYRIANSLCFLGNDQRIRCTACHDPHSDLVRDAASYDRNCLSCHRNKSAQLAAAANATQKPCTVGENQCVSCHMPKVTLAGTPGMVTDHQIRIVHPGDRYPN